MTTLNEFCKGIQITTEYNSEPPPWGDGTFTDGWKVTLRRSTNGRSRQLTVPFWKGLDHNGVEPTVIEVMEALCSDAASIENAPGGFEDWCGEMGDDSDSRCAERTYNGCRRIRDRLERFLGADFETFLYAEAGS